MLIQNSWNVMLNFFEMFNCSEEDKFSKQTQKNYKELFEQEINNIPQSLFKYGKNGIKLYHGSKAEITKKFNSPTFVMLPHDQEVKADIVVEMSPMIRAKTFATHTGSLTSLLFISGLLWSYEICIKLRQDRSGFWLILWEKSLGRDKIW